MAFCWVITPPSTTHPHHLLDKGAEPESKVPTSGSPGAIPDATDDGHVMKIVRPPSQVEASSSVARDHRDPADLVLCLCGSTVCPSAVEVGART